MKDTQDKVMDLGELRSEKVEIYRIGMVEVMYPFLLFSIMAEVLVIRILWDHYDILLKLLCDRLYYCGLA